MLCPYRTFRLVSMIINSISKENKKQKEVSLDICRTFKHNNLQTIYAEENSLIHSVIEKSVYTIGKISVSILYQTKVYILV